MHTKNVSELFMEPADKHYMSYQTPIFSFLPPQRLSISMWLSIMRNTGRDKAVGQMEERPPHCLKEHTRTTTHMDKGRQRYNFFSSKGAH